MPVVLVILLVWMLGDLYLTSLCYTVSNSSSVVPPFCYIVSSSSSFAFFGTLYLVLVTFLFLLLPCTLFLCSGFVLFFSSKAVSAKSIISINCLPSRCVCQFCRSFEFSTHQAL